MTLHGSLSFESNDKEPCSVSMWSITISGRFRGGGGEGGALATNENCNIQSFWNFVPEPNGGAP